MLNKADRADFQRVFPQLFAMLPATGVERLLQSCARVDFHPGRNVFRDRMPTDALYFVLSGEADIFVEKDDRNIPLGRIGAGQLLGEISVLSRQMTASSTVQASSKMSTFKLMHQPLEGLLMAEDTGPALLDLLSETLASRLRTPA
jgi:CRP-like cAMP-binding protein